MHRLFLKGILYGLLLYLAYDALTGIGLLMYEYEGEVIPCELSEYSKEVIQCQSMR